MSALLEARDLVKRYRWRRPGWHARRGWVTAVDRVSLTVARGECLGLVGESGSGKTTLARCLLRLLEPDAGSVRFDGEDLLTLRPAALRRRRRGLQAVFQDPGSALDPRLRVGAQLAEPLRIHAVVPRDEVPRRVAALLERVGLAASLADRYPHQLSGGQRQRACIARALATEPRLLVLDEPVSALDVSVQARIMGLLAELRQRYRLAMIFISHDLTVVEQIADRVAVMHLGRVVEEGPREAVFARPRHAHTASLLAAVQDPGNFSREHP